ncbi:ABC transporter substrate-binding protein [Microbacterium aoyamense]|uniref:ABC transporter substrate-binding protein n=1 Tax=Microbacterium aoyamense TaxID=344166 RepID=UPI002003DA19|nr:ABC transporter substrate-binding protein [Microbacterium aoyamense]
MIRRARLLSSLALVAASAFALTACSGSTESSESDADAAWTFASGDGETYTAPDVPTRIIAHAYAAKALMEFGITPVAVYADGPISEDVGLEGVDFDGIEVIGEEWGKIDVAAAAELAPDLIVGDWWPAEDAYSGFEGGVEEESKKLAELAPVVGPSQGDSIVGLIEGYADLAESLGADPDQIADARAEFDAAVADFQAANEENPGVSALAISPWDVNYAIAVPEYAPELLDFQRWGLAVVDPETPDPDFPYWETLSMEQADAYQPDLIMFDDRNAPGGEEILAAAPISSSITAFAAGQTTTWPAYWLHTYSDYTQQLSRLAEVIRGTDTSVGAL